MKTPRNGCINIAYAEDTCQPQPIRDFKKAQRSIEFRCVLGQRWRWGGGGVHGMSVVLCG
eukprot:COSAG02_NODE_131_length_34710_cov_17.171159_13_plen_60_part_00